MGDIFVPSPQGKLGSKTAKKARNKGLPENAAHIPPTRRNGSAQAQQAHQGPTRQNIKQLPSDKAASSPRKFKGRSSPVAAAASEANLPDMMRAPNWIGRSAYAALDLGTNNCRLLIARAAQDGFTVVDAFSRVVRLGEGLATTGRMSEDAMDRAVDALRICADKLKKRNVVLAHSVATEACRRAENGMDFIERVQRETGIHLNVITAEQEARLAVNGCYSLLNDGNGPALIFDIGGGSTELVLVATGGGAPHILDWVSIPWGVVSLTESVPYDYSTTDSRMESYAQMRKTVSDSLSAFVTRLPDTAGDRRMMGTSGTVTTLSSVFLRLKSYDRSKIDGLQVTAKDMRAVAQELAACSLDERAAYPTIGRDRADLVVAGCAILEAIFDIWPGEHLGIADRGIREGILRNLMAKPKHKTDRRR